MASTAMARFSRARASAPARRAPASAPVRLEVVQPQRPSFARRAGGAVARRGAGYVKERGGIAATAKHVGGLAVGGALGGLAQGTASGLGLGPVATKAVVVAAAVALGSGAARGSWTDKITDGMIASAGAGLIYDGLNWWRQRPRNVQANAGGNFMGPPVPGSQPAQGTPQAAPQGTPQAAQGAR